VRGWLAEGAELALSRDRRSARRPRGPCLGPCGSPLQDVAESARAARSAARPPQCRTRPRAPGVPTTPSAFQAAPRQPRNIEKGGSRGAAFGGAEAGATTKLLKNRAEASVGPRPAMRRDGHGAEGAGATSKLLKSRAQASVGPRPAMRRDGHGAEDAGATSKLLKTRAEASVGPRPAMRRDGQGAEDAVATTKLLKTRAEAPRHYRARRTSDAPRWARRRPTMCHLCPRSEVSPMSPV
jgi:hypothetical protein